MCIEAGKATSGPFGSAVCTKIHCLIEGEANATLLTRLFSTVNTTRFTAPPRMTSTKSSMSHPGLQLLAVRKFNSSPISKSSPTPSPPRNNKPSTGATSPNSEGSADDEHKEITLRSLMSWGGVRKAYRVFGKPFLIIYTGLWLSVLGVFYLIIISLDCGELIMSKIAQVPYIGEWLKKMADAHPTLRDPVIAFAMADLTEIIRIPLAVILTRRYVRMQRLKRGRT